MASSAAEMLESAGLKNIREYDAKPAPGLAIHEMGTARMGHDPKKSVLNKYNQMHDVPNVFITDGSAMTSSPSCAGPSVQDSHRGTTHDQNTSKTPHPIHDIAEPVDQCLC